MLDLRAGLRVSGPGVVGTVIFLRVPLGTGYSDHILSGLMFYDVGPLVLSGGYWGPLLWMRIEDGIERCSSALSIFKKYIGRE